MTPGGAPARARVGLLGGTFDPPHMGHLIVAQDVLEALELDEVRFVVAGRSPFKEAGESTPGEVRARMVEAAVGPDPRFRVSRLEVERGGTSYTVDTLRALGAAEPATDWSLIIGADQLERFAEWREPREVARLAELVVMGREGRDPEETTFEDRDVHWRSVEVTRVDISSTRVRRRVSRGRPVRYLVPDAVRRIIEEEKLYREAPSGPRAR